MLENIEKNRYNLYLRDDIKDLGVPMIVRNQEKPKNLWSKSYLRREYKIKLTEEQENNPDAFAQGINGYYPLYNVDKYLV